MLFAVLTLYLFPVRKADRDVAELVRASLDATGAVKVVEQRAGADLLGHFGASHHDGGTGLELRVTRGGALFVDAEEFAGPHDSMIDAVQRLAAQVAAAAGGHAPPPQRAFVAEAPAEEPKKPREPEDATDWRSPYDRSARRLDFIAGLELAEGPWSADPQKIVNGADTGFDLTHYAPLFTRTIDGRWHPAATLHGGVMFLGAGAFEMASRRAGRAAAPR